MKIVLFLLFFTNMIFGQSNFVSLGGDLLNNQGSISYSIGQINYINISNANAAINLGVQQPFEFYISEIDNPEPSDAMVSIFPNPTFEDIVVEVNTKTDLLYLASIFSIDGRLISNHILNENRSIISLRHLPNASYILNFYTKEQKLFKSFKIIKI